MSNFKINEKKVYRKDYICKSMDKEKSLFSEIEAKRRDFLFSGMDEYFSRRRKLTLINTVKNESTYLLEWIAYHQEIGVDGFVVLDNGSTDKTPQVLQQLNDAGVICYSPWPTAHQYEKQQISACASAMMRIQERDYSEWVSLIDPDEFFVVRNNQSLLDALPDGDAVFVHWAFFGSGGAETREDGLVIERFLKRAPLAHWGNRSGKFIARAKEISDHFHHPHDILISDMAKYRHADGTPFKGRPKERSEWPDEDVVLKRHEHISLNHYAVKSREEFMEKAAKGRVNYRPDEGKILMHDSYFKGHDYNNVRDDTLLAFVDRVRSRVEALEAVVDV